jgi:hypothetical protein
VILPGKFSAPIGRTGQSENGQRVVTPQHAELASKTEVISDTELTVEANFCLRFLIHHLHGLALTHSSLLPVLGISLLHLSFTGSNVLPTIFPAPATAIANNLKEEYEGARSRIGGARLNVAALREEEIP